MDQRAAGSQLLEQQAEQKKPKAEKALSELRLILQTLFTKPGRPRANVKAFREHLLASNLLFLDTIKLDEEYRGKGIAPLALQSYHALVLGLLHAEDGEATSATTALLSPARSSNTALAKGKSDVDVERGLIRAYRRSEYEVWLQGAEEEEGSVTVMGRVL